MLPAAMSACIKNTLYCSNYCLGGPHFCSLVLKSQQNIVFDVAQLRACSNYVVMYAFKVQCLHLLCLRVLNRTTESELKPCQQVRSFI